MLYSFQKTTNHKYLYRCQMYPISEAPLKGDQPLAILLE